MRRFIDVFGAPQGATFMHFEHALRFPSALLCVACLLIAGNARDGFGQTSTATLTGIVQDPTGAVLPNVTISVRNTERNTDHFTRSNEAGNYVLPALNPGNYSVSAELPGFKKFVRDGIVLRVSQVGRIDIRLDLGSLENTIEV